MSELSIVIGADRPDLIRDETLMDLFSETVKMYPDKTALIFDDKQLTYAELDQWSDAVAAYLIENGIGPSSYVGVWWQRGLELHVAILGILKAGAAYVPVDNTAIECELQNSPGSHTAEQRGGGFKSLVACRRGMCLCTLYFRQHRQTQRHTYQS
jgi:non-ribosomal peptide synthetase component F